MSVNNTNIKQVRIDIIAALAEIGKKYGANFSVGTIRYNSLEMRCKITGRNQSQTNLLHATIAKPISLSGLVGKRFKVKRSIYTVLSTNDKPKYNVQVRNDKGVTYGTTLEFLQSGVEL